MVRAWLRALGWRRRPVSVAGYEDAALVPLHDPVAVRNAFHRLPGLRGRTYRDPCSRDRTVLRYGELMEQLGHSFTISQSAASG